MGKSNRVTTQKRLGRPPTTGRGLQIGERWHRPELAAIDAWIEAAGILMTRGEAIRRLVEIGLTVTKHAPAVRVIRARELAAKTIEKVIDPSASPDERKLRRHRLTRGPLEFREDRIDLPKPKSRK